MVDQGHQKELYLAARDYYLARPWEVIPDSSIFGLCLYQSDVPFFCSVLGNSGLVQGLTVYPGGQGLKTLDRIFQDSGEGEGDEDFIFEQSCFTVMFGERREILPKELEFLQRLDWKRLAPGCWPNFRSLVPGYCPWYYSRNEMVVMYQALRQAVEIAEKYARRPQDIGPRQDGAVLFRIGQGRYWQEKRLVPVEIFGHEEKKRLDRETVERISKFKEKALDRSGEWEIDVFYVKTMVKDRRPYFPYVWAAMECGSGLILHLEAGRRDEASILFRKQFLSLLEGLPLWPASIRFKKPVVEEIFGPLAAALGIEMVKAQGLEFVEEMRTGMEEFFKHPHRRGEE